MTAEDSPKTEDTSWSPVFITEFLVILIINFITITAFARTRHLRKRSTYLIINLTVADLLVGALTGPLFVYSEQDCSWPGLIFSVLYATFPIASQLNLSLISLEQLHATRFPFRHCLLTKWVYFKIIIANWVISFSLAFVLAKVTQGVLIQYVWASFSVITLLVLTVSYIIIFVNVQSKPHSQRHGSVHKERKLSITLLIVTAVFILTILPMAIYNSLPEAINKKWHRSASKGDIRLIVVVIYFANSMVNPLVYAIRMQEFRKAFVNLVSRQSQGDKRQQAGAEQERCYDSQPQTVL